MSQSQWTWRQIAFWAVAAILTCLWQGPAFMKSLAPPRHAIYDFFQEWSSARFALDGIPIYSSPQYALEHYLDYYPASHGIMLVVNAHPPTSVVLALPLAWLDYPDAFLIWNLISLAILGTSLWVVSRQLQIRQSPWAILPTMVLLLLCSPFHHQMIQGQLNLILLGLLTGIWAADRQAHPRWAGILLGAATAIKIFPGFLFIYFALRRRWTVVTAGVVSLAGITLGTAAVLGISSYWTYGTVGMQHVGEYRGSWINASLTGFCSRLFHPGEMVGNVAPIADSPLLVTVGVALCGLVLIGIMARECVGATTQPDHDLTFALAVTTMLLVSPVCWNHYLVMLLIPLAILWRRLPSHGWRRWVFRGILAIVWISPTLIWHGSGMLPLGMAYTQYQAGPMQSIGILSIQMYALLFLFALLCLERRGITHRAGRLPSWIPARISSSLRRISCCTVPKLL